MGSISFFMDFVLPWNWHTKEAFAQFMSNAVLDYVSSLKIMIHEYYIMQGYAPWQSMVIARNLLDQSAIHTTLAGS